MTLSITSLVHVGLNNEAAAVAEEAAARAFPGVAVRAEVSLEAALAAPAASGELLLLGQPSPSAVTTARAAIDARGLPRWPVIVLGSEPVAAWTLPPEDWNARTLPRLLQAAAAAHVLARENARLRGDLLTLGRRLSHDLRTPLMGIATACDGIKEAPPEDSDSRDVFTRSISSSSDEISKLMDRISAVLKASAEAKPKESVEMGNIVWAALQRLERRLSRQGAVVGQPSGWPTVPGIGGWLEIIWGNLLANALDHAGREPQIAIGWQEEAGGWRFWVEDRGPGVAPRVAGSLFQPFDLLHHPSAPRGWGLPVVQRLVELQGGRCGHEARTEGGARFFFTLPA
jgi:signal transduction histidine kinase